MLSQERRMKRYRIIYTWKILEGKSPNCGILSKNNERLGRMCDIPQIKVNSRKAIQTLRENSFQVNGPRLFNCLPKKIRNKRRCSVEEFKAELDIFLETIPDEPRYDRYIPAACNQGTARPSNSIIDQYSKQNLTWYKCVRVDHNPAFCNNSILLFVLTDSDKGIKAYNLIFINVKLFTESGFKESTSAMIAETTV